MSFTQNLVNRWIASLVYITISVMILSTTCRAVGVTSNISLTVIKGAYLDGKIYSRVDMVGLKMCSAMCYRNTNCSSFNFNKKQLQCQLILVNSSTTPQSVNHPDFSYSTRDSWSGFGGPCEQDPCTDSFQQCVESREKKFCINLECMSFPDKIVRHSTIRNATSNSARSVGNVFEYVCNDGFRMFGKEKITCKPDMNFTLPDPTLTCYRFYKDWVLVARFTQGAGPSPRSTWGNTGMDSDKDNTLEEDCYSVVASAACNKHYRSGLVDQWQALDIREVRVAVYLDGVEQAYVIFDGAGSTYSSWFSPNNIIKSSWTDVTSSTNYRLFSLEGLTGPIDRSFCINDYLNACHDDLGWLHIIEDNGFCDYDVLGPYPYFMYSPEPVSGNMQTGFKTADVFAILVKIDNFP